MDLSGANQILLPLTETVRLSFLATERYRDILGEGELEPVPGSAAPFELTKADIQRMVAE